MPLYKGTTEISSNKLYKASTNIENGYKGTSSFYINQVTIEFASITGLGLTYTTPTSRTGNPGTSYTSTTFTISGTSGQRLTPSSFAMTNLPSSLSASVTSGSGSQTLTVTISGNFPNSSVAPITSVVSGVNITTDYNTHWLIVGGGAGAGSGYVAGGGGGGGVKTSWGSVNGGGQAMGSQMTLTPNTSYTVTVATAGNDSTFNGITATAGSGGGGSTASPRSGGNAGEFGYSGGGASSMYGAGGGGGAGGAGGSVSNGGGNGGAPVSIDITGSATNYGSGGAGYTGNYGSGSSTASAYGKGGDGSGGAGQQGVVILRLATSNLGTITGTHTTSTVGSDTVIQWTGNGTYVA